MNVVAPILASGCGAVTLILALGEPPGAISQITPPAFQPSLSNMQSQEATRPTTNVFSVALKSRLICRFVHSCPINRTVHTDQITSKTGEDELFNIMR